jgi:hypothetical protein
MVKLYHNNSGWQRGICQNSTNLFFTKWATTAVYKVCGTIFIFPDFFRIEALIIFNRATNPRALDRVQFLFILENLVSDENIIRNHFQDYWMPFFFVVAIDKLHADIISSQPRMATTSCKELAQCLLNSPAFSRHPFPLRRSSSIGRISPSLFALLLLHSKQARTVLVSLGTLCFNHLVGSYLVLRWSTVAISGLVFLISASVVNSVNR